MFLLPELGREFFVLAYPPTRILRTPLPPDDVIFGKLPFEKMSGGLEKIPCLSLGRGTWKNFELLYRDLEKFRRKIPNYPPLYGLWDLQSSPSFFKSHGPYIGRILIFIFPTYFFIFLHISVIFLHISFIIPSYFFLHIPSCFLHTSSYSWDLEKFRVSSKALGLGKIASFPLGPGTKKNVFIFPSY